MEMQSGSGSSSRSPPISTLLPYRIKGSIPKKLFTASIVLLRFLNDIDLPPWMVLSVKNSKAGVTQFFNPFTRTLITNLPQNLQITQFHSTCLSSEYHIISSYDPFPSDSLYLKALIVDGVSSKCTLLTLFIGGQVYKAYPFDGSEYHAFEKAFHIHTLVEDLVIYNSKVYALDNLEKLYLYRKGETNRRFFSGDCGFYFDQVVVEKSIAASNVNVKRGRRRRLVVLKSSRGDNGNKLYMIVPVEDGYLRGPIRAIQLHFKVKELKQKGSSNWLWEEVSCFGDGDQVLFVSRDYCFFVDVAEFPGRRLRNCIVFSDDAFPEYSGSESSWNYGSNEGNEVAVFSLEGLSRFSEPVDLYFPNSLWSTPIWLLQNVSSSFQPQAQSQSRRQSEPVVTQSDLNVKSKKPFKSASEEQSTGVSSNEIQADSTRFSPAMTDVRHTMEQDVRRDNVQDAVGQTQRDFSAHSLQPFEKKVVTVKFQGIDVELEHLPILEKIKRKYGDVVDGSAIRGCDAITMAWTSVAKMLLILHNSGNTLTDDQASYLSTTLSDLQFMQLKVDWLVPHVKKALAMQEKRKQLQASLAELEKAKARAEEMEQNLRSEMAEMRRAGPLHLEDCLDDGLF